jgi:hypothetical protein
MLVSVGQHTVTETLSGLGESSYELDTSHPTGGIAVTPSTAEVSRNTLARSVKVDVPWAGAYGEEVRVDFYNRIKRFQLKVCKDITPGSADSLSNKPFTFTAYALNASVNIGPLKPGECALAIDPATNSVATFSILNPADGMPLVIGVVEQGAENGTPALGDFYVSNIHLQGGYNKETNCVSAGYSPTGQHCKLLLAGPVHITFNPGPNTNTVHFTNTAGDP